MAAKEHTDYQPGKTIKSCAVSYTHLDVYKRQPENRVWLTRHQIADLFGVFVPVSYTHLTEVLCFDSEKELDKQPYFKLWHLLYSFEGDSRCV